MLSSQRISFPYSHQNSFLLQASMHAYYSFLLFLIIPKSLSLCPPLFLSSLPSSVSQSTHPYYHKGHSLS